MADLDLRFQRWHSPRVEARHRSIWIEEALARDPAAPTPLDADRQYQVCIIGGGYTGLWTAIRLREQEPSVTIAVVEASLCGCGASGRNSGGTGTWWSKLWALIRLVGKEDALTVLNASIKGVEDIESFVAAHDIDCDLRHMPSVWSATAPAQVGAWERAFKAAEQMGLEPPWRRLGETELRHLFGHLGPYVAGVIDDRAPRVQPALLARGLRRQAAKMSVDIYERSPVSRISSQGRKLRVQTAHGSIVCDQLVLAANAWMAHLPEFQPHITVTSSEIVATDPIPELLAQLGMQHRPHGVNSRMMLNYGGISPAGVVYLGRGGGTIAFRGRIGPEFDWSAKNVDEVEADFRFLYPELNQVPIARSWSGPIDHSTTALPWFGQLKACAQVHYGIGFSGHGVGATALGGRILASLVLGKQDEWAAVSGCLQRARRGRFPPEPIRYIGGHLVRAAVARKELAESERRVPTRLDQALAQLAAPNTS